MSMLHTIINRGIRIRRQFYEPENPFDYNAMRRQELAATSLVRVPKTVSFTRGTLGGVNAQWIRKSGSPEDRIALYIHGGGFCTGASDARKGFTSYIADSLGVNVVSLDYRLAPEHPFPQGAEDCLAAYKALLEIYAPDKIVFIGESAGGNLVLSLLLSAKAHMLPLPAAVFAISPTVQYDRELPSYRDNLHTDSIVTNLAPEICDVYLRSHDKAVLRDPIAAPYYGDYRGCPPVILWASRSEVLLDDSLILFDRLKEQGTSSRLYLRDGMMHAWPVVPQLPESKKDLKLLGMDMNSAFDGTLTDVREPILLK